MIFSKSGKEHNAIQFLTVLLAMMLALALPNNSHAQSASCRWTELVNLSESPDSDSGYATAVGDRSGRVHVFWTESPPQSSESNRQYIVYRSLTGTTWSTSHDILLAPEGGWAEVAEAVIDPSGRYLHLAWIDNLGVSISTADTSQAWNARSWNTFRLAAGDRMGPPALVIDNTGRLHALYVREFGTLVYTNSSNQGFSWDEGTIVSEVPTEDQAIWHPNLLVDNLGGLHAAWAVYEQHLDWTPSGIRYANSFDGGRTWSAPIEFSEYPGGDPTLAEDSNGAIHLLWNGRAGSGGRYYTWTQDRGTTWSPMESLNGYLGGLSGRPQIVTDSAGILHVLQGSGLKNGGGTNSAYLIGFEWSPPISIPDAPGSDYPSLAISGGNQLHAFIWSQVPPAEILYSTCLVDAPPLTPVPTPETALPIATSIPETGTDDGESHIKFADDSNKSATVPSTKVGVTINPSTRSPVIHPALVGTMSALVLIFATLVAHHRRH